MRKKGKVLVTGANGALATHVIRELLEEGYAVRGMLRNKAKFQLQSHPDLELIEGDILNAEAVEAAVMGCDFLIHSAAVTSPNLSSYEDYRRPNVSGTINLLKAAKKYQLNKFVFVGSANSVGYGSKQEPGNENTGMKPPFTDALYAKSKLEAQNKVLSFSDKIPVVVVNPSFMIGAHDAKPGSGRIVLMGYNKRVVFHPSGGKNFVNTKDVAKGALAALEKGQNGRVYLMTGENLSYREFFEKLNARSTKNGRLIKIPEMLLKSAGYISLLPRKLKIRTEFSPVNMKILTIANYYDNSRARKELGVEFRPVEEGINEAIDWFKKEGML